MNLIFIRTPFFIQVDSASQVESKVELFIWHKGETEPATPTYTLSKKAASTTQTKNVYNISNYVKEFIDIVRNQFMGGGIQEEEYNNWCFVKIKRYKATTIGSYTLIDTLNYVATNGYWDYQSGSSAVIGNTFVSLNLFQQNKIYKYYDGIEYLYPYLSFFIDYINDTDVYEARYTNFETIPTVSNQTILDGETEEVYLFTIPVRPSDVEFNDGCKLEILKNNVVISTYIFKPECEPKYTPIRIDYVNKYGGWGFITFFKAKTQNWEVKNKEYKLLPDDVSYNTLKGETKAFNYEAKQSIKLNTGWVDESYNELIKDLMVSETIMLYDYEVEDTYFALKPVKLKTMSTDLKSSIQDKMINYQLEFEYDYNQIQNVI